jgi:hypothetical protein
MVPIYKNNILKLVCIDGTNDKYIWDENKNGWYIKHDK